MRADTFAKLVALETLIDAEIGHLLATPRAAHDRFREGMVSRIGDVVDEVDALDAVAAARVYDAVVDFLSELPEDGDDEGVVECTLRFKRAVDRIVDRGMEPAERAEPVTWAFVLDELLGLLPAEYARAAGGDGRADLRARALVARARDAGERMVAAERPERRDEIRSQLDRLAFAVLHRRPEADAVEVLARAARSTARRYRPSDLSRVGAYVLGQLLRRRERPARPERPPAEPRRRGWRRRRDDPDDDR